MTATDHALELVEEMSDDEFGKMLSGGASASKTPDPLPCTDLGNAQRLVSHHGHDFFYVPTFRKFFAWDGRRWQADDTGEVVRRAKDTVISILEEAKSVEDDGKRKGLVNWQLRSESEPRISAMLKLVTTELSIPVLPDKLDVDPWLLTVPNGTIDLRHGRLRSHSRADRITKIAPVTFEQGAKSPLWEAYLERVLDGNRELIWFVQKAVGYALTGRTDEQVAFFLYGTGANGKTTLLETVRALLGDYAMQAAFSTFLAQRHDGARNDLARLRGARFVSAVEVEQGRRLSESVMKEATGGDTLAARFLYSEYFEFIPAFKLFLAVNHKPVIRGTDHAIWRRIRLVPFTITIPPDEQDRALLDKLRAELPGILQWALKGCMGWQAEGLGEAQAVNAATERYREEMDVLAAFLDDRCLVTPNGRVAASELYAEYKRWADQSGEYVLSQRMLGTLLGEREFTKRRAGSNGAWWWFGLALNGRNDSEPFSHNSPRVRVQEKVSGERFGKVQEGSVSDDEPPF